MSLLQIKLAAMLSLFFDQKAPEDAKRHFETADSPGHVRKKDGVGTGAFTEMSLQLLFKSCISMQYPQILKNSEEYSVIRAGHGYPALGDVFPLSQTVAPVGIAGHHVAGTKRHSNVFKGGDDAFGKTLNLRHLVGGKIIAVHYCAVLVGAQGLLLPTFTAKRQIGRTCRKPDVFAAIQDKNQASGHGVIKVCDQLDQALYVRIGLDGILQHAGHLLPQQNQLVDGGSRFYLLNQIQGAAGLDAEQIGVGQHSDKMILFINHYQPVDIMLGHQKNGFEKVIAAADGDQSAFHDIAYNQAGKIAGPVGNQVAQVAQGYYSDRFFPINDDNAGNIVPFHDAGHFDKAKFKRTGYRRTTTDRINRNKEKTVFADSRHKTLLGKHFTQFRR